MVQLEGPKLPLANSMLPTELRKAADNDERLGVKIKGHRVKSCLSPLRLPEQSCSPENNTVQR